MQGFASAAITQAMPEPGEWLMLLSGGSLLGWIERRRQRQLRV